MHGSYFKFAAMIAASTIAMLGLMYLNTFQLSHVFWSETRTYMALYMGAATAMIMLGMYANRQLNIAIVAGSAVVFALALYLVRSQVAVGDVSYMKAMIPHHSIAILTSRRAQLVDPRVRKLADGIVQTQLREIVAMRCLIAEIKGKWR